MKNTKKVIAAAMTALILLSGCNSKKEPVSTNEIPEGTLVSNEPITISMLYADNASYPYKEDWMVLREISKRTNVNLDLNVVPDSDYAEKRQILLSSGSAPDIITHTYANQVSDYATSGVLLPISDYMEYMPNLTEKIERWNLQEEWDSLKELDGKVYVAQGFSEYLTQSIAMGARKDIFEKYGLSIPESYEELYEDLKYIKQQDPSIVGLSDRAKGDLLLSMLARCFDTNAGYSLPSGYTYDRTNEEWVFAPTSDNFKEMLQYLNKLYNEGLLDPEAFTQDTNQFKQKLYNGKVVVAGMWLGEEDTFTPEIQAATGNPDADFDAILPMAGPRGTRATKSASRLNGGFAISASAKDKPYFYQLLKFVDWLYYSDEAIELNSWGVEGETFTVNENGQKELMPNVINYRHPDATFSLQRDGGCNTNSLQICYDTEYLAYANDEDYQTFMNTMREENMIPEDDPNLKFTDEELEEQKIIVSTLVDYYKEMTMKFIYGQASIENDWDSYVQECSTKGVDKLMELVNTAWERQNQQ